MVEAEARTGERIHPVIDEQAADDEPQQKVGQIAGANRVRMEAQRHARRVPIDDHADEREQSNAAQLGQPELRERAAVLRRQIGQIIGELVEPVHAGTCAR